MRLTMAAVRERESGRANGSGEREAEKARVYFERARERARERGRNVTYRFQGGEELFLTYFDVPVCVHHAFIFSRETREIYNLRMKSGRERESQQKFYLNHFLQRLVSRFSLHSRINEKAAKKNIFRPMMLE
jgi:hypothetical protein